MPVVMHVHLQLGRSNDAFNDPGQEGWPCRPQRPGPAAASGEAPGSATVLATDRTGTLTPGHDDRPGPGDPSSSASITSGALLPLLAILLPPATLRVPVTFVAVLIALGLAGALSARIGGSDIRRAVLRVVFGARQLARMPRAGPLRKPAIREANYASVRASRSAAESA
jgi:hypothetical protein